MVMDNNLNSSLQIPAYMTNIVASNIILHI